MMQNLQHLSVPQRRLVFALLFIGVLMALLTVTLLLASMTINTSSRPLAFAVDEAVTVREFAALPDEDSYPAAVAANSEAVYTGSYATGAIWRISPDGSASEIPGTRDAIGAVSGLALTADGALLIVDQQDTDPRSAGGSIQRLAPDGTISRFATIDDERGFLTPDDIDLDSEGRVYVTDRGRNEVWRFDADGQNGALWWTPPAGEQRGAVTGLAYDAANDALIVTDPELNTLYSVSIADASETILYRHPENGATPPGFDGVTVSPDGVVYAAALGQNGIVRLDGGSIVYIAGQFRGASDVAYAEPGMLYVTNFDQSSLVLPLVEPRLPFALDVVTLASPS